MIDLLHTHDAWLLSVVLVPVVMASLALVPVCRDAVFRLAALAALPALAVSLVGPVEASWPSLFLGTTLTTDGIRATWLFFTAVLWFCAAWFGRHYLEHDPARARYNFYFLGAMTGNIGLVIAGDPVSFFTFFAVMSFLSYGLVVHDGQAASRRAGKVYLGMAVLGEVFQFAALAMAIFPIIGTFSAPVFQSLELLVEPSGAVIALFIAGFGIKAGLLGLHVWLPMAHPVAPTPASAVLSGSMIKAGVLGWLFFLPMGEAAHPVAGSVMVTLGLAGAFAAALYGSLQTNPKAVLAYSSVSQMGLITTGIGVAMSSPHLWPAMTWVVVMYAAHHAFAKCLLFLGVGIRSTRPLAGGEGTLFWGGTLVAALALIGAPFTSGMVAKAALKGAVGDGPVVLLLTIAAAGTTALMVRYLVTLRRIEYDPHHVAPRALLLPWLVLLAMVLGFTFYLGRALAVSHTLFIATGAWWKGLLPFAGGLLVYGLVQKIWRRAPWHPSPGDVYIPLAASGNRIAGALNRANFAWEEWWATRGHETASAARVQVKAWLDRISDFENRLAIWSAGSVVVILASAWMFWLVFRGG